MGKIKNGTRNWEQNLLLVPLLCFLANYHLPLNDFFLPSSLMGLREPQKFLLVFFTVLGKIIFLVDNFEKYIPLTLFILPPPPYAVKNKLQSF